MSISLVQKIQFIADRKSKFEDIVISNIILPDIVKERGFQEWKNIILPIPDIFPTSNEASNIIKVNYCVVFYIVPSGMARSKNLTIPITIGTISFREDLNSGLSVLQPYSFKEYFFRQNTNISNEDEKNVQYYENY